MRRAGFNACGTSAPIQSVRKASPRTDRRTTGAPRSRRPPQWPGGAVRDQQPTGVLRARQAEALTDGLTLGPVGGRIVTETLIGLLRPQLVPPLPAIPRTDLQLGSNLDPKITGNRTPTRAHFLYYARVAAPGTYR